EPASSSLGGGSKKTDHTSPTSWSEGSASKSIEEDQDEDDPEKAIIRNGARINYQTKAENIDASSPSARKTERQNILQQELEVLQGLALRVKLALQQASANALSQCEDRCPHFSVWKNHRAAAASKKRIFLGLEKQGQSASDDHRIQNNNVPSHSLAAAAEEAVVEL
ncbi:unnamed protein product, partial [Amoebophrya sp. A25]